MSLTSEDRAFWKKCLTEARALCPTGKPREVGDWAIRYLSQCAPGGQDQIERISVHLRAEQATSDACDEIQRARQQRLEATKVGWDGQPFTVTKNVPGTLGVRERDDDGLPVGDHVQLGLEDVSLADLEISIRRRVAMYETVGMELRRDRAIVKIGLRIRAHTVGQVFAHLGMDPYNFRLDDLLAAAR